MGWINLVTRELAQEKYQLNFKWTILLGSAETVLDFRENPFMLGSSSKTILIVVGCIFGFGCLCMIVSAILCCPGKKEEVIVEEDVHEEVHENVVIHED